MAVSASLHRNVYLLSQMVSPNEAFKRNFREGMFDKSNTSGFIDVSHFLLTIYDADRFKKSVEWPVICKKSESKYRNDVKDFLNIVASEHPEAGFPPILATHLLRAGGTKFIILMWKLSQVVLYVHIKRESQGHVLSTPQSGITDELTKAFLNNAISNIRRNILQLNNQFAETERRARDAVEEEASEMKNIQNETFEKRLAIAELASKALAAPVVKKRLTDIQDVEIIEMWKANLAKQIEKLQEQTDALKSIDELCTEVAELTMSLLNDSKTLDLSRLPKIEANNDLHSMVPPQSQVLFSRLYTEGKLVLQNLLKIVHTLLCQLRHQLNIHKFQNLSQCQLQIQASNEDAISMCQLFLVLLNKNTMLATEVHNTLRTKNINKHVPESAEVLLRVIDDVLFMPSPTICIHTEPNSENPDVRNRLALTPVEGAHRVLFSRHKRTDQSTPQSSKMRTNLVVSRINFQDTLSSITNEQVLPQNRRLKMLSRLNSSLPKKSEKYSRLFSGHDKLRVNRANCSIMSMPSNPKANSTALINTMGEANSIPEISLDFTAKSLFNLSREIISAVSVMTNPNNHSPMKQNKPEMPFVANGDEMEINSKTPVTSPVPSPVPSPKVIKPLLDDDREIELTRKCFLTVPSSKKQNRRSISDLLDRYKAFLAKTTITSHLETSENSNDSK